MLLLSIGFILTIPIQASRSSNEIIVEHPFYVRARIHDSHTASVLFEIGRETNQRKCQMYKFTIHYNRQQSHSMPQQNLTYWRNSLELKHLTAGQYKVCAIICSEKLHLNYNRQGGYYNKTRLGPIATCVHFRIYRPLLLVLTLYVAVFIILGFAQVTFSLRKRKIQARIKISLMEFENSLETWRTAHPAAVSTDQPHTYHILQNLINLPAVPIGQSHLGRLEPDDHEQDPILFHLERLNERQGSL